jgi:hypothetical protein
MLHFIHVAPQRGLEADMVAERAPRSQTVELDLISFLKGSAQG